MPRSTCSRRSRGRCSCARLERAHLILLGRGEPAPECRSPAEKISAPVKRLVENLGPGPAFLLGRRYDYLAWNEAFVVVFGDPELVPRAERNLLWLMFTDPARRELVVDWEHMARLCAAKFRADSTPHLGDPDFEQLIASLRRSSPEFCEAWRRHEVEHAREGRKVLNHPVAGRMVFDHAAFTLLQVAEQRLVVYSPTDEAETAAKLDDLLEARRQQQRELVLAG